jgi:glutamate---cysteine ligase / carboxylate-amine ligase
MGEDSKTLGIFEGYGIELEYMIVNQQTLAVMPVTDKVIQEVTGEITGDAELGDMGWSNELVLHVIEIKTNGPSKKLSHLPTKFHDQVKHINDILKGMGGKLMPTAMHPWMNPYEEMKLWPHDNSPIYDAYNRIFDCRGHGWANLQSMHINLPFKDDEEFGKLHAAVRLVLPIFAAIAASSPIVEGA